MTQHHLMTSLTLLLMSPPLLAAAVTPSAGPPAAEDIEVVKVTSTRLSRDLFATPAAVSLLDARQELQLQEALQLVDVRVLDHVIVGGGHTVSLAERGMI